jgi:N-acylneuraminate cytidylyltransferase
MVSTDDKEIASVSKRFGACIPFLRSADKSNDYATLSDVILEVIEQYRDQGLSFKSFCCILATAPFISDIDLSKSHSVLKDSNCDTLMPVVRFSYPIDRALLIDNGKLKLRWPENIDKRSNDLPETYHDAGLYYWGDADQFLKNKTLFTENTMPYILKDCQAQDIDTKEDWVYAEQKYKLLLNI